MSISSVGRVRRSAPNLLPSMPTIIGIKLSQSQFAVTRPNKHTFPSFQKILFWHPEGETGLSFTSSVGRECGFCDIVNDRALVSANLIWHTCVLRPIPATDLCIPLSFIQFALLMYLCYRTGVLRFSLLLKSVLSKDILTWDWLADGVYSRRAVTSGPRYNKE